ncbi:hypothetical protein Fmac_005850 [Flemingia macrophylla]|uniref:TFIIB-type domain-containing protein n=1 Tax=Flemingia macrophylla TaxID=520843 RepID=A0ABD1N8Y0_9FABA
MSVAFCSDCMRQTEVVFDHSDGDTVCSECSVVLESHSIDETYEWRIFANESGDNDPVRVGGPTNPLLTDGGLSTVIAKPNGGSGEFLSSSLGRWQNRGSNPDRALILAFKTIATMSDSDYGSYNVTEPPIDAPRDPLYKTEREILKDVFNLLPNLNVADLIKAFTVKTNDMMLMLNKEHERAEDSKSVTVPSAAA